MMYRVKRFFYQMIRLFRFLPCVLENDWDFESRYLLYLELKLQYLYKVLDKTRIYVGVEKHLKQIKIVLEHITRYNDLQECKYTYRKKPKYGTIQGKYQLMQNYELEKYHWEEISKYIVKYSQRWWW